MRPWILAETNYGVTKELRYEVAVLPLGATEPHNLHLPYGTDMFEAQTVGEQICEAAWQQGAKVVLLPTLPYGTETNMRRFPLAINVNPSTLQRLIGDIVASLVQSGIRKIVLLNSHGGNDLKPVLRELHGQTPAQLFLCNWYQVLGQAYQELFVQPEDHAGEMETSFALAWFPHLVARRDDGTLAADEGRSAITRFDAINQGWVSIARPWHLLTTNTGSGNPHAATADKGRRLLRALVERLSPFLVELAAAELDERFPY
ncbi:MAG: creatininase family protein [Pirellulaceae bacterium]|nr:creatininase family protein [Pirellulaceae bacterium]